MALEFLKLLFVIRNRYSIFFSLRSFIERFLPYEKVAFGYWFWAGFVLLGIAIEYIWDKATLPQLNENAVLAASVKAGILYSIFKIAFHYTSLIMQLKGLSEENRNFFIALLKYY
jgi:hypothetical protein